MRSHLQRLKDGETFIAIEKTSHAPLLKAHQKFIMMPAKIEDIKIGDIIYCKRTPVFRKVKDISSKGLLVVDEHGNLDGYTSVVHGKIFI